MDKNTFSSINIIPEPQRNQREVYSMISHACEPPEGNWHCEDNLVPERHQLQLCTSLPKKANVSLYLEKNKGRIRKQTL